MTSQGEVLRPRWRPLQYRLTKLDTQQTDDRDTLTPDWPNAERAKAHDHADANTPRRQVHQDQANRQWHLWHVLARHRLVDADDPRHEGGLAQKPSSKGATRHSARSKGVAGVRTPSALAAPPPAHTHSPLHAAPLRINPLGLFPLLRRLSSTAIASPTGTRSCALRRAPRTRSSAFSWSGHREGISAHSFRGASAPVAASPSRRSSVCSIRRARRSPTAITSSSSCTGT